MKSLLVFFTLILFFSCSKKNKNMEIIMNIEGFKKGKVSLQKVSDSTLITVDSIFVNNESPLNLSYDLKSPELFYVTIDVSKNDKTIEFFGEKGEIIINSKLKNFSSEFKVRNSFNDSIYRNYLEIIRRFNFEELDLIKSSIEMTKLKQNDSIIKIQEKIQVLNKRKALFNLNFAVNNGNSSVAPLIAINNFSESKVLLDTIIKSMDEEIINSKYGKELKTIYDSN